MLYVIYRYWSLARKPASQGKLTHKCKFCCPALWSGVCDWLYYSQFIPLPHATLADAELDKEFWFCFFVDISGENGVDLYLLGFQNGVENVARRAPRRFDRNDEETVQNAAASGAAGGDTTLSLAALNGTTSLVRLIRFFANISEWVNTFTFHSAERNTHSPANDK